MVNFKVGDLEKHNISFKYDTNFGKITVLVDGEKRISSRKMIIGTTPFTFQVGEKEKHSVRLVLNNPLGSPFRGSDLTAYVDDKLVHEEHIPANPIALIFFMILTILAFYLLVFGFAATSVVNSL